MIRFSAEQLVEISEEDERRIVWMEQTGAEIDRDHQRFIEESRAQQATANENIRRFILEGNTEGLAELAQAQTQFDHNVRRELDLRYQRERRLRIEALKDLGKRRFRLNQLVEEVRRSTLRTPTPIEQSRLEEIRLAQQQATETP